ACRGTPRGALSAAAGEAGGDPEAGWGERELGIPTALDRFMQQATAAGPATAVRPDLLGCKLRLPARTECARRGASRAGLCARRSTRCTRPAFRRTSGGSLQRGRIRLPTSAFGSLIVCATSNHCILDDKCIHLCA